MKKFLWLALLATLAWAPAARAQIAPQGCANCSTVVIKAGAGSLVDGYVTVSGAGYLYVINSPTAYVSGNIAYGTASGDYQDCISITAAGSQGLSSFGLPYEKFSAGISLAWSSTACPATSGAITLQSAVMMKARSQ